jgi:hypothetical protein
MTNNQVLMAAIGLVVGALSWRNLWQAYRTGTVIYRPDFWDRRVHPYHFWMVVLLCVMFGLVGAPALIAAAFGLI